jgi:phosphatidylglycerol---prolipoprotein diacylglyceryl transferase
MRPFLLKIPIPFTDIFLPIHSYGFMLAMAFLFALLLSARQARQQGEDPDHAYGLIYWVLISAILGARLMYGLVNYSSFASQPWKILFVWEGGLVYYGGLLAALFGSIFYVRKHGLNYWKWADFVAPGIALGLAFGRTGCFLVGCCHGKQCAHDFPLALTFPDATIGVAGIPLFPTQLWAIAGNLAICVFLYFLIRPRKTFHGQVMALFLLVYSVFRSGVELWRGDDRGFWTLFEIGGTPGVTANTPGLMGKLVYFENLSELSAGLYAVRLTTSQLVSLATAAFAIAVYFIQRRRAPVRAAEKEKNVKGKAATAAVVIMLAAALMVSSCSMKSRSLRMDEVESIEGLTGTSAENEAELLSARVESLWTELTSQKLTAYITKKKISPYFRTQKELSEFIAIYASLFRELSFDREIVKKYRVNKIVLEQNGVIARVDMTIWGKIYFIWQAKIHESQQWIKSDGQWYLVPQAY